MDGECEPPGTGSRRVFRVPPERAGAPVTKARRGFVAAAFACVVAAVVAPLAGCGFHLQGAATLSEANRRIYISTSDLLTPFAIELRRSIERSGGEIVPSVGEASTVLRIRYDRSGRRVLSVSARNTPQEYEAFYSIEYSVDRAGQEVMEPQPLELARVFSFDDSELLAKDREEAILRGAMARDLATLVLRRIGTL